MDIQSLLTDYSIAFDTKGKNIQDGWVGMKCCWCDDHSNHLGYNLDDNYMVCWRCGARPLIPTLSKLLNIPERDIPSIVKGYGMTIHRVSKEPELHIRTKAFKLPSGTMPLQPNHISYLKKRIFDIDYLTKVWNIMGTGPIAKLDNIDYKHRLIIPFKWDGKVVSFDSRDITGKDPSRYRACPKDRELISHKDIVYGVQEHWKECGICVEGPTDAWRLGIRSFAVSGIKFTPAQVRVISKTFKRVAVVFDEEPQAKIQADKLVAELKFRRVDAFRVDIKGDPGSMEQSEADYMVKQLIEYKMNYYIKY